VPSEEDVRRAPGPGGVLHQRHNCSTGGQRSCRRAAGWRAAGGACRPVRICSAAGVVPHGHWRAAGGARRPVRLGSTSKNSGVVAHGHIIDTSDTWSRATLWNLMFIVCQVPSRTGTKHGHSQLPSPVSWRELHHLQRMKSLQQCFQELCAIFEHFDACRQKQSQRSFMYTLEHHHSSQTNNNNTNMTSSGCLRTAQLRAHHCSSSSCHQTCFLQGCSSCQQGT
jgi:hypothetical protein